MKAKYLWFVLITLVFFGCDDNTGSLGLGMLPGEDEIIVNTQNFKFQTESTNAKFEGGRIYAKTDIGYVGRFTDNEYGFGYYEGSYLTELNCVDDLTFPKPYDKDTNRSRDNMASKNLYESIDSVQIELGYYQFFGDSLTPMQVSVYQLNKELNKKDNPDFYFTDIDPSTYYDSKTGLLGKKTFSATDLADDKRHEKDHLFWVTIKLDKEIGKEIVERNWNHPEDFANSEAFKKFFNGVYVTSEVGSGTVLYVQHTQLAIYYKSVALDSLGNTIKYHNTNIDSTYARSRAFASTMEILQTNRVEVDTDKITEKLGEHDCTYIKAPAGIYTKAVLPIKEFVSELKLERDTINSVKLVLDAYHHEKTNEYSMSAPQSVLLIRESEVDDFFKKNALPNSTTSYVTDLENNQYTFTNITRLVTTYIKEMEEAEEKAKKDNLSWNATQWLEENPVAIIPVYVSRSKASNGTITINNVQHEMKPTYVKLKGGQSSDPLDLQVIYSRFK